MKLKLLVLFLLSSFYTFAQDLQKDDFTILHHNSPINSDSNDFSQLAYGNDILYLISDRNDKMELLRTEYVDNAWKKPLNPAIFFTDQDYKDGTFTPDYNRLYYSSCETVNNKTTCNIYTMQRQEYIWTKPEKLPISINAENTTNENPYVIVKEDKEILYFVSDRAGGEGGKDIWYAIKPANSDELDFGTVYNLGREVNTSKDEITPYIHQPTNTLYFSSNGQSDNIGGFDIYQTRGQSLDWNEVKRLPAPINSKADESNFIFQDNNRSGYFASNRTIADKKTENDFDIFSFDIQVETASMQGKLIDKDHKLITSPTKIEVYETNSLGEFRIRILQITDGTFTMNLTRGKTYKFKPKNENYIPLDKIWYLDEHTPSDLFEINFELTPLPSKDQPTNNIISPEKQH